MWVILVVVVIVVCIIGVCMAPCTHSLLRKAKEHLTCCSCLKTQQVRREESIRKIKAKSVTQTEEGQLVEERQEV